MTDDELKHLFDAMRQEIGAFRQDVRDEIGTIRQEMRTGFADTQAMIKFSHAELDRRVRTVEENQRALEDALAALQSRVERLEGSTH